LPRQGGTTSHVHIVGGQRKHKLGAANQSPIIEAAGCRKASLRAFKILMASLSMRVRKLDCLPVVESSQQ
jgi:hypothetical protein